MAGFGLTLLLREVPLRKTVEATGLGETFAMPREDDPLNEIGRALSRLARDLVAHQQAEQPKAA